MFLNEKCFHSFVPFIQRIYFRLAFKVSSCDAKLGAFHMSRTFQLFFVQTVYIFHKNAYLTLLYM